MRVPLTMLVLFLTVLVVSLPGPLLAQGGTALTLDGRSLLPATVVTASRAPVIVTVSPEAWQRVREANTVLLTAAAAGQPIYGLTTGVGANKDQSVNQDGRLFNDEGQPTDEFRTESIAFNRALLHAHAAGTGDPLPPDTVRAILLIRLNTALTGGSGMDEAMVRRFAEFLNHDILPVIPSHGSVGEADITILAHIGLAMMGKWEVAYRGERMPAAQALRGAGLAPIEPFGKDALASFSSNAFSAAEAVFALAEMKAIARTARLVYALSLEGLNGNIAPVLLEPSLMRPFPYAAAVAGSVRGILRDSYLTHPSAERALQDPLSFRTALHQLGALDRSLVELEDLLVLQLNSADDNPVVFLGEPDPFTVAQPGIVAVSRGSIRGVVVPSANFSPLPYVIALQRTALAAAHVSVGSLNRTLRLANDHFTHLKRFLGTEETVHAFGAIQKPIVALAAANRDLANPVSLDFMPVAIEVEDMATNAAHAARRLRAMGANLTGLLGFETMHAAQAMDLRLRSQTTVQMASATAAFMQAFRRHVPFLERDDQIPTRNIAAATAFIAGYDSAAGGQ
jgi:histidine ammonia-lyase